MIYLLPNFIGEASQDLLPPIVAQLLPKIDFLIAESPRGARAFLSFFKVKKEFHLLSEHTTDKEVDFLIEEVKKASCVAVISDSGSCAIADPAYRIVAKAAQQKIPVQAIPGPCSIMQAIMLSGFSGQAFAFHGYLPKDKKIAKNFVLTLEKRSKEENALQLFIETPYRNRQIIEFLISILSDQTYLGMISAIGSVTEKREVLKVAGWKKRDLSFIPDSPSIFFIR